MDNIMKDEVIDGIRTLHLKRLKTTKQASARKTTFVGPDDYSLIVSFDCDGYDYATGDLLFRFRKAAMPEKILAAGVENYKHSISISNNRGDAAGGTKRRMNPDGTPSNIMMADDAQSGNVGFMSPGGLQPYCRMTAFGRNDFEKLQLGRPFVEFIDAKYKELCPTQHAAQLKTANETNANYVLWDTAFSTITVNKNFRTAVHVDNGDHYEGFGNLFVYREGDWKRGYFTLLEWGVGVDMQNTDMLFVDVHKYHANDLFEGFDPDNGDLRISFVLYYRTKLRNCKAPSDQVEELKTKKSSYLRI